MDLRLVYFIVSLLLLAWSCLTMSSRYIYSRNDLLRLRSRGLPLLRSMRRDLWYAKLLLKRPHDVPTRVSYRIPVIVGRFRSSSSVDVTRPRGSSSSLVRVKLQQIPRRGRRTLPSILLANVRSLFNKIDEIAYLLRQHCIQLAFFVETWLHSDIPDEAVAIEGYSIVRRDRALRDGGGIICYFSSTLLPPTIITSRDVPSIGICSSEFLPLFFPSLSLLTIACYHPFWNNPSEHSSAIDCISDIMDYVTINESCSCKLRITVLGDFNDLCQMSDSQLVKI